MTALYVPPTEESDHKKQNMSLQLIAQQTTANITPTTTYGDIIYRNATTNARLAAGTAGYLLQTNGASAAPSWVFGLVGVNTTVPTLTEFSGGQISTQGILNNSLSLYASPTAIATSTIFSAAVDYSSLVGGGTAPVASFGATTGAANTAHVRVNSTFLEDHTSTTTEHVAMFACGRQWGGAKTFAANIQVIGSGTGTIVGLEIDVDGNSTTISSLGLGVYGRTNGSAFSGGYGMLVTAEAGATWTTGLHMDGDFGHAGISTYAITTTPTAMHMANNQRLAWDGGTPGTIRSWIVFNQSTAKFEFYIDGAKVAQLP